MIGASVPGGKRACKAEFPLDSKDKGRPSEEL